MLDKDKVDVETIDVEPFVNEKCRGFTIYWRDANIGFGEYTIYKVDEDKQWRADSEYMDSKDDTWLLNKLFEKFKSMLVCF